MMCISVHARAVVSMLAVSALLNKNPLLPGGVCNKICLLPGGAGKWASARYPPVVRSWGVDPKRDAVTALPFNHAVSAQALMYISGFKAAPALVTTACRCPTPRIAQDLARASL